MRRRYLVLVPILLLFASGCTVVEKWAKDAGKKAAAEFLAEQAPETAKKADTDGDGKASFAEWRTYLLSGTGFLALAAELLRRKINGVKDETNQALAVAHARIDRRQRRSDA